MIRTFEIESGIIVKPNERLLEGEIYLVSGPSIVTFRDGEAVRLDGAEAERVRRWLLRDRS